MTRFKMIDNMFFFIEGEVTLHLKDRVEMLHQANGFYILFYQKNLRPYPLDVEFL